jgi:hypothetical protein
MSDFELLSPEMTRRDGVPGVPVVLGDGRTWFLAVPTLRIVPQFKDSECVGYLPTWSYPYQATDAVERLQEAARESVESVPITLVFTTAAELLKLAHDVTTEDAAKILACDSDGVGALVEGIARAFQNGTAGDVPEPEEKELPTAVAGDVSKRARSGPETVPPAELPEMIPPDSFKVRATPHADAFFEGMLNL